MCSGRWDLWRNEDTGEYLNCKYRGDSLIKNTPLLGPYSRTIPRVLRWS